MRALLILILLVLAGCTESTGDITSLAGAESARLETNSASGPDGTMNAMRGTIGVAMSMDGETIEMDLEFIATLHENDSFRVVITLAMEGDYAMNGDLELTCTPEQLMFVINVDGENEILQGENTAGECLGAADLSAMLEAFHDLEGFETSGLGTLGMTPDQPFPYTSIEQVGGSTYANYIGNFDEAGISMSYNGRDAIRGGLIRDSTVALDVDGFDMTFDMYMSFSYGARTPL